MFRDCNDIDSVRWQKRYDEDNVKTLFRAQNAWWSLDDARKMRERCLRFRFGDQWSDKVVLDPTDPFRRRVIREDEHLTEQGYSPIVNNMIQLVVRSIVGVYRSQSKEPTCVARAREEQRYGETASTLLQYCQQRNEMADLNARMLEDFLCGSIAVYRKTCGYRGKEFDAWTEYVNPGLWFVDGNMQDVRGWDCTLIGQIHDLSFGEVVNAFAHDHGGYKKIAEEYNVARNLGYYAELADRYNQRRVESTDFFVPNDPSICRVIEVWTKETKERYRIHDYLTGDLDIIEPEELGERVKAENEQRIAMARAAGISEDDITIARETGEAEGIKLITAEYVIDTYWYYRYLTPTGKVLQEGETPYEHGEHPYVFLLYPYINGEIKSPVNDLIDINKFINRQLALNDFIVRNSAKGFLLVPDYALEGVDIDEFGQAWRMPNGMAVYKAKAGMPVPQQISQNCTNIGTMDILQMEMKMFEDVSGVHGSLQGKPGASSVSGVLYAQQAQNSSMTLLDLLETFAGFERRGAMKDLQNILQYYTDDMIEDIVGEDAEVIRSVRHARYDIAITESTATPVYRQLANDFYRDLMLNGLVTVEEGFKFGDFPRGDAFLQAREAAKQEAEEAQSQQQAMQQEGAGPQEPPQQQAMPQ